MGLRKKLALAGFTLLGLAAGGAWFYNTSSRTQVERYKADLREKGEKLLASELAVAPSTNADEVACQNIFATNQVAAPGMLPALMDYAGPGVARVAWRGALKLDAGKGTWAELEQQVAQAEPTLAVFRKALEHPAPDCGWKYGDDFSTNGPRPNFLMKRALAQDFASATVCALRRGDLPGACANLHAIANLAQVEKNDLPLAWGMVRMAVAGVGLSATWEALQAPGWTEARLGQLQRDWEQFDAIEALEHSVQGERAMNQRIMAWVRTSSGEEFDRVMRLWTKPPAQGEALLTSLATIWRTHVVHTAYKIGALSADEMAQLEYYDAALAGIRKLKANQGFAKLGNPGSNAVAALDKKVTLDKLHRLRLTAMIVPNLTRAVETAGQNETQRRMTVTAIAIKRYELKRGAPPVELSALVPEFLAAVPMDVMSGKALRYQLNSDNTYTLYSTGMDGVDNGGDPTMAVGPKVGLWTGKDALWPTAVTDDQAAEFLRTDAKAGK